MLRTSLPLALVCSCLSPAIAQCQLQWQSGEPLAGTNGTVNASVLWDPDGSGPSPELLVVGGNFTAAGAYATRGIATFDFATGVWGSVGGGVNGIVYALAIMPGGELVVGGDFSVAGSVAAGRIASWNGSSWVPLGAGVGHIVSTMVVDAAGALVAGGRISSGVGVPAGQVARWDGSNWTALGIGMNGPVNSLALHPNGDLLAGGVFSTADGVAAVGLARWNGGSWQSLGSGLPPDVSQVAVSTNGDVVVGGSGLALVGTRRWNGTAWIAMPNSPSSSCLFLEATANGGFVFGGSFSSPTGVNSWRIATWDGLTWSEAPESPAAPHSVRTLRQRANGELIIGGTLSSVRSVSRWSGSQWVAIGAGVLGYATCLLSLANGDVVASGAFHGAAGSHLLRKWDGTNWQPFAPGLGALPNALIELPDGRLLAAGPFGLMGSATVAAWDGVGWTAMSTGLSTAAVWDLLQAPSGLHLVTDSAPCVRRWDGTSWVGVGSLSLYQPRALAAMPNGDIIVGSTWANGWPIGLARWNGNAWTSLGFVGGSVLDLIVDRGGELLVAGNFQYLGALLCNRVGRWTGSAFVAMGAGFDDDVNGLELLPNGDVVAVGRFASSGGVPTRRCARWDGLAWSELEGGIEGVAQAVALSRQGTLMVGGFGAVAGAANPVVAATVAVLRSTCPANAVAYGSGCSTPSGSIALAALDPAWLGSVFRARATGFATTAIALWVFGFSAAQIPLATIHPLGEPGCDLLTSPDLLVAELPVGGSANAAVTIPVNPTLVGANFNCQAIGLDLPNGVLTSLFASSAQLVTIGSW